VGVTPRSRPSGLAPKKLRVSTPLRELRVADPPKFVLSPGVGSPLACFFGERREFPLPHIGVQLMTLSLFANPYDITASGFYFSSAADFEAKFESHLPVEEYEIEFIDGDEAESEIFNAMKVSQANLVRYFEVIEELESDELRSAALCYLLGNGIASNIDDAMEQSSDVSLFEGTVEDYAWEYLEDCVFTKDTPEIFKNYFDVKSFARDLELGGDVTTFDWCGRKFVASGV
jgi:hypothetical protein